MIKLRPLEKQDISEVVAEFRKNNWPKPASTFERYLSESDRFNYIAHSKDQLAGYVTLKLKSQYLPFANSNVPEIMDLNVLPKFRNRGIGSALLETAEKEAVNHNNIVGLGVGLYADYGAAQNLYIKRGYIPNGLGITYKYQYINPGTEVLLDDDLVLWLTKRLK